PPDRPRHRGVRGAQPDRAARPSAPGPGLDRWPDRVAPGPGRRAGRGARRQHRRPRRAHGPPGGVPARLADPARGGGGLAGGRGAARGQGEVPVTIRLVHVWPVVVPERLAGGMAATIEARTTAAGAYPPEWPAVAWLVKTIAGWRCERCQ